MIQWLNDSLMPKILSCSSNVRYETESKAPDRLRKFISSPHWSSTGCPHSSCQCSKFSTWDLLLTNPYCYDETSVKDQDHFPSYNSTVHVFFNRIAPILQSPISNRWKFPRISTQWPSEFDFQRLRYSPSLIPIVVLQWIVLSVTILGLFSKQQGSARTESTPKLSRLYDRPFCQLKQKIHQTSSKLELTVSIHGIPRRSYQLRRK